MAPRKPQVEPETPAPTYKLHILTPAFGAVSFHSTPEEVRDALHEHRTAGLTINEFSVWRDGSDGDEDITGEFA